MWKLAQRNLELFKKNIKLKPTPIKDLTVNKYLHICRIIYDAHEKLSYFEYHHDNTFSDEEVYCKRKMIVPNETAWREEDRDSISVMEKIIDRRGLPGYHFEELEFVVLELED